jgi:hypothetical protein
VYDNLQAFQAARILTIILALLTSAASAQILNTLLSFKGTNGMRPDGTLIQGSDGNFYGVAENGGLTNQQCTNGGCETSHCCTPSVRYSIARTVKSLLRRWCKPPTAISRPRQIRGMARMPEPFSRSTQAAH